MGSPAELGGRSAHLVYVDPGDLAVGEREDAVRYLLNAGIMSDDERRGPECRIDVQYGFDDLDPGLEIEGAGWFISKQDFWSLSDGAADGDALLLAAPEFGREWLIRLSSPTSASASSGNTRPRHAVGDNW